MSDLTQWTLSLPRDLTEELLSLVNRVPESGPVLTKLFQVLSSSNGHEPAPSSHANKRHHPDASAPVLGDATGPVRITEPVSPNTVIFEIQQVLFQSPVRKKLNLTFHLVEQNGVPVPVLSIVNPSTLIPETSIINLSKAVKTCLLLPILGNLTNSQKKNVVTFCLWLNDSCLDAASTLRDPIVCSLNLDLIRKQMVRNGKLPLNLDHLNQDPNSQNQNSHDLSPLIGRLVDYFQRQFKLCGITLINALPCNGNAMLLNSDSVVQIRSPDEASFILIEAHNRAKDGALIFVSLPNALPYVIFGFKKPILFFDAYRIKLVQYSNITRNTFSLLITVISGTLEDVIEFGMIDEPVFSVVDEFVKTHNINDDSFNEELREKPTVQAATPAEDAATANLPGLLASIQTDQQEDESDDESYHEGMNAGSDMLEGDSGSDIDDLDATDTEDLTGVATIDEETHVGTPSLASDFTTTQPGVTQAPDTDTVFSNTVEIEELA